MKDLFKSWWEKGPKNVIIIIIVIIISVNFFCSKIEIGLFFYTMGKDKIPPYDILWNVTKTLRQRPNFSSCCRNLKMLNVIQEDHMLNPLKQIFIFLRKSNLLTLSGGLIHINSIISLPMVGESLAELFVNSLVDIHRNKTEPSVCRIPYLGLTR